MIKKFFAKRDIFQDTEAEAGFSIVEVLVAISIAAVTLGGFSTAVVLSLRAFESSGEYYTATQIAREGMEFAVNKRDNNVECVTAGGCQISDWQENLTGVFELSAAETELLAPTETLDSYVPDHYLCLQSGGRYGYCADDKLPENFTRKLSINAETSDSVRVVSEVSWESRNGMRTIQLEEIFYGP